MKEDQEPHEYTIAELAAEWGVAPKTVRRYILLGQLPAIRERHGRGFEYRIRLAEGTPRFLGRGHAPAPRARRSAPARLSTEMRVLVDLLQRSQALHERTAQTLADDLRAARERVATLERELGARERGEGRRG